MGDIHIVKQYQNMLLDHKDLHFAKKNIIKERITTTPVGDQGYKGVGKHAKSKVAHIEQKHKKNK